MQSSFGKKYKKQKAHFTNWNPIIVKLQIRDSDLECGNNSENGIFS